MMRRNQWTAARALAHLKSIRPIVNPNEGLLHELAKFEALQATKTA